MINVDMQKYNALEATIAEAKAKYKDIKINGLEDKEGYKIAKEAKGVVVKIRTGIETVRKVMKADALAYGKAVDAEAKRITALNYEIETPLAEEIQKIDDAKAEIEAQAQKALDEKIAMRKKDITDMGAVFEYQTESFVLGDVQIADKDVRWLSNEQFNDLLFEMSEEAAKLQEAKDMADAKAKADAEEAEKLRKENEELRAKVAKQEVEPTLKKDIKDCQNMEGDIVNKVVDEARTKELIEEEKTLIRKILVEFYNYSMDNFDGELREVAIYRFIDQKYTN